MVVTIREFLKPKYRIAYDRCGYYTVEYKRWWWPFWKMPRANSHITVTAAREWAEKHANPEVAYLGKL